MSVNKKTVWVIGGSSGLGSYVVEALSQAGHNVIVGARSYGSKAITEGNISKIPLDVTNENSRKTFTNEALKISNEVDAFIYCAGIIVFGPCEFTKIEEYNNVLNTNFIGAVAMVQEVLPVLREQKSGKIILFSSINGLMGTPFQSAYVASKHAIEGYSECLAMELKEFNIDVCVVEPGDHKSGKAIYRNNYSEILNDNIYNNTFLKGREKILNDEKNGSDPSKLGKAILRLVNKNNPPHRTIISSLDQKFAVYLHRLLPYKFVKSIMVKYYLG